MTAPNNLNTDPLVLNDDSTLSNGHVEANGSSNANGQSVADHAVNAKNSLLNCEVRDAP